RWWTLAISPSFPWRLTTFPARGEGTVTVALSVISSTTPWSSVMVSPGATSHLTISPSITPSPMSGSLNSKVATAVRLLLAGAALLHQALEEELRRPVAAPDEGASSHVQESHPRRQLLEAIELRGRDEAGHPQVVLRGLEVLAEGQHVHPRLAQIGEGLDQLLLGLSEADHDRALGIELLGPVLEIAEDTEALPVSGPPVADDGGETLHRLHVVGHHVGPGLGHRGQVPLHALEIGDQHLHRRPGALPAQGPDRSGEVARSPVGAVIAVDAGHHDVL